MTKAEEAAKVRASTVRVHAISEDELLKLERTRARISKALSIIAATVGAATAGFALFIQIGTRDPGLQNASFEIATARDRAEIQQLTTAVRRLAQEQRQLENSLNQTGDADLQLMNAKVSQIAERQERIEQAIMGTPQRALELPLLRNDLDNMRKTNEEQLESIRATANQAYDINKWLLGMIGASILGLGLNNLLTRKNSDAT